MLGLEVGRFPSSKTGSSADTQKVVLSRRNRSRCGALVKKFLSSRLEHSRIVVAVNPSRHAREIEKKLGGSSSFNAYHVSS